MWCQWVISVSKTWLWRHGKKHRCTATSLFCCINCSSFLLQLVGFVLEKWNFWIHDFNLTRQPSLYWGGGRRSLKICFWSRSALDFSIFPWPPGTAGDGGCNPDDWRRPSRAKWGTRRWGDCTLGPAIVNHPELFVDVCFRQKGGLRPKSTYSQYFHFTTAP